MSSLYIFITTHVCIHTHTHTSTVPLCLQINVKLFYSRNQDFAITPKEVTSCDFPPCGATQRREGGRAIWRGRMQAGLKVGTLCSYAPLPPPPLTSFGQHAAPIQTNELIHGVPLGSPLEPPTLTTYRGSSDLTSESISRSRENAEEPAVSAIRSCWLNSSPYSPRTTIRVKVKHPSEPVFVRVGVQYQRQCWQSLDEGPMRDYRAYG